MNRTERLLRAISTGTFQSWDWDNDGGYFKLGEVNDSLTPRGLAVRAIKTELEWLGREIGYDTLPMTDNGVYGSNTYGNIKKLQKDAGLIVDGVTGPNTMKALCRRRIDNFAKQLNLDEHLCKAIMLESALYPACRNTTMDFGISQIHVPHEPSEIRYPKTDKPISPDGSWLYVYRIGVNVRYMAEYQYEMWQIYDDWRAVVFSYNAPAWAADWAADGYPASGGGTVTVGNWTGDKYTWATMYCNAVDKQVC